MINALIGAAGDTYYVDAEDPRADAGVDKRIFEQIKAFAQAAAGAEAVLVIEANPVLTHAPCGIGYCGVLKKGREFRFMRGIA